MNFLKLNFAVKLQTRLLYHEAQQQQKKIELPKKNVKVKGGKVLILTIQKPHAMSLLF